MRNLPKGRYFLNFIILLIKAFNFAFFSLKHIFIIKRYKSSEMLLRFIVEITNESVNLIQIQNRIKNYYHYDEEELVFYKKKYTSNHSMSKKKDVLVILHRKKRMSFNLSDKNCTQENVQLHLQHGEI